MTVYLQTDRRGGLPGQKGQWSSELATTVTPEGRLWIRPVQGVPKVRASFVFCISLRRNIRQKYKTHHFECHCLKFYFDTNMSQCLSSSAPHSLLFAMTPVSDRAQYQTTLSLLCSLLLCVPDFNLSEKKPNGMRIYIVF